MVAQPVPMIRSEYDNRVVIQASRCYRIKDTAHVVINELDHAEIIRYGVP